MRLLSASCLASGLLVTAAPAVAQDCFGGTLFKNDILDDQPSGQITVSVIPGLCVGEAAGSVFDLPGGTPQVLTKCSVGFGANGGIQGASAVVNLEIYDGVTFNGSNAVLGPKVFDFADDVGGNIQVFSTGLNEVDITFENVVVGAGGSSNYVVAWRMLINENGDCPTGYTSNFFTDNTQSGLFGCNPSITPQGKNLIDIEGQGWQDAALATVTGIPLCPLFYSGNWVIRACGFDATPTNPLQVQVSGSPVPPGGFAQLIFQAPGYENVPYVAAASFGTVPGIPVSSGVPPVADVFPLNPDSLFFLSLNTPSVFSNFIGLIGATGTAPGIVFVPNNPALSGIQFFVAFAALAPSPAPYGISDAAVVAVQ